MRSLHDPLAHHERDIMLDLTGRAGRVPPMGRSGSNSAQDGDPEGGGYHPSQKLSNPAHSDLTPSEIRAIWDEAARVVGHEEAE